MALEIVLTCLVLTNVLNVVLIYDLYGRSARLAVHAQALRQSVGKIVHILTSHSP
jgi:ribosomal protein L28